MSIELSDVDIAEVARIVQLPPCYKITRIVLNSTGCECVISDVEDTILACMNGSVREGRIAEWDIDDTAGEYAWEVLAHFTR